MVAQEKLQEAIALLRAAKKVTALTGAGVSKESGIPTFREAQTGLWAKYDPEKLATPEGFRKDPSLVWTWYDYRRNLVSQARPNNGHIALVDLQDILPVTVVTQNVDGLHARAGSKDIIELHGNILKFFCFDHRHPADNVPSGLNAPPACTICGAMIRPGVVWFGEALPPGALEQAAASVESSDIVLVIGTSGLVHPAAGLPYLARRAGAKVIEINPDTTPITDIADIFLGGPSGTVVPALVAGLRR
jgi:NAD-dependent deacetylase